MCQKLANYPGYGNEQFDTTILLHCIDWYKITEYLLTFLCVIIIK